MRDGVRLMCTIALVTLLPVAGACKEETTELDIMAGLEGPLARQNVEARRQAMEHLEQAAWEACLPHFRIKDFSFKLKGGGTYDAFKDYELHAVRVLQVSAHTPDGMKVVTVEHTFACRPVRWRWRKLTYDDGPTTYKLYHDLWVSEDIAVHTEGIPLHEYEEKMTREARRQLRRASLERCASSFRLPAARSAGIGSYAAFQGYEQVGLKVEKVEKSGYVGMSKVTVSHAFRCRPATWRGGRVVYPPRMKDFAFEHSVRIPAKFAWYLR